MLVGLLFGQHLIQDGHHPILEGAVVAVRHHEVPDTVHALFPELSTNGSKRVEISGSQALDQVFFDATCRRDDSRDMAVFDKIAKGLPQARGD